MKGGGKEEENGDGEGEGEIISALGWQVFEYHAHTAAKARGSSASSRPEASQLHRPALVMAMCAREAINATHAEDAPAVAKD